MRPVEKAIWYIETHYMRPITLDDVAAAASVSRFHLSRAFGYVTGMSFSRYLRLRRLSAAAVRLGEGEADILGLAISLGYGSHEAFSRAFKDCFGVTPESVRAQQHTRNLELMKERRMAAYKTIKLPDPEICDAETLLLAGLSRHYEAGGNSGIPGQWRAFNVREAELSGVTGDAAWGIVYNTDEAQNFDYLCGLPVSDFSSLPEGFTSLRLPPQRYAVFRHPGHVSEIQNVCEAVWAGWLPASGWEAADAPFLERYPQAFNSETGHGGFEIWLPVTLAPVDG